MVERRVGDVEASVWVVVVLSLGRVQLFCDSMDYSLPGSSLHGISRARIVAKVAISFCS